MIRTGAIQFDWVNRKPPPPERVSFGFFFRPILERLRPCYWLSDYWHLAWPHSEAAGLAVTQVVDGVTLPDTVLPDHAFELTGDREEFYGFASEPPARQPFDAARFAARQADNAKWTEFIGPKYHGPLFEAGRRRYDAHVRVHGTAFDRFLADAGVEFAFLTNDSVWWIAFRDPAVGEELTAHAQATPGMTYRPTTSFGG